MKKTLVALAALAATASFAQSSVQIDGIFDAGYQQINYKGDNNTVSGIAQNGSATSQLNFRGTQDLGGGLKANFRLESDFNAVSTNANTGLASSTNATTAASSINSVGSTFGNGEVRVGLQGDFGRVDMGAVNYNFITTFNTAQPFGTAIGSGFRTVMVADAQATSQIRAENAIRFTTPKFNGLEATVYWSGKQSKATASTPSSTATNGLNPQANAFSTSLGAYLQQGSSELGLNYANGPLTASYSRLQQDWAGIPATQSTGATNGTATYTFQTLAAKYDLGNGFAGGFTTQTQKTDTGSVNVSGTYLSGTYTTGPYVLMAQAGSSTANAGTYNGKKSTLTGWGVDYNLSKTAAIYVRAESIQDDARLMNSAVNPVQIVGVNSAASAGDQRFARTAVGLRVAF